MRDEVLRADPDDLRFRRAGRAFGLWRSAVSQPEKGERAVLALGGGLSTTVTTLAGSPQEPQTQVSASAELAEPKHRPSSQARNAGTGLSPWLDSPTL